MSGYTEWADIGDDVLFVVFVLFLQFGNLGFFEFLLLGSEELDP